MDRTNPAAILLTHNAWANAQLVRACEALTHEQFHQRFDIGPGSLHDTLTHILGAMRGWADLLARRDFRPRPEGASRTLAELASLLDESAREWDVLAAVGPMDEPFTRERGGKNYTFTRAEVVTHITTHGVHHRAQAINMLRRLGVEKMPASSVMEWVISGSGG